jgi:hypothetical protein
MAARRDRACNDPLPLDIAGDRRAELFDDANGLMSDREALGDRVLALQNMDVGTADRGGGDPHQRIGRAHVRNQLLIQDDARMDSTITALPGSRPAFRDNAHVSRPVSPLCIGARHPPRNAACIAFSTPERRVPRHCRRRRLPRSLHPVIDRRLRPPQHAVSVREFVTAFWAVNFDSKMVIMSRHDSPPQQFARNANPYSAVYPTRYCFRSTSRGSCYFLRIGYCATQHRGPGLIIYRVCSAGALGISQNFVNSVA